MTGKQKDTLDRIARAIADARKALFDLRSIGVPEGEASEALEEMDAGLIALSDDNRAECSSGVLCGLFEAIKESTKHKCETCGSLHLFTDDKCVPA